jgi:hypothetical protein
MRHPLFRLWKARTETTPRALDRPTVGGAPRFETGTVQISVAARRLLGCSHQRIEYLLERHVRADWGDLVEEENAGELERGGPVWSRWILAEGVVCVWTNGVRTRTRIMTQEEFLAG